MRRAALRSGSDLAPVALAILSDVLSTPVDEFDAVGKLVGPLPADEVTQQPSVALMGCQFTISTGSSTPKFLYRSEMVLLEVPGKVGACTFGTSKRCGSCTSFGRDVHAVCC